MIYYTHQLVVTDGWTAPLSLLAFFILSCLITRAIIPPIARLVFVKEKREGDFRYLHVRLVDHAESISLLHGQNKEKSILDGRLLKVLETQKSLITMQALMAFAIGCVDYLGTLVSYSVVAVPIFMGRVEPNATAIGQHLFISFYLLNVFTTIVDLADKFADLAGYIARIGQFLMRLEEEGEKERLYEASLDEVVYSDQEKESHNSLQSEETKEPPSVSIKDLSYGPSADAKQPIIQNLSFSISQGQHLVIFGKSGCGKSSLLKVLGQIWSPLSGSFHLPSDTYIQPQLPYLLCGGSLKDQLAYPNPGETLDEQTFLDLIKDAELESLLDKHDQWTHSQSLVLKQKPSKNAFTNLNQNDIRSAQNEDWTSSLSAGEKQRLAFGRILWRCPSFALLDEGTVHMDPALERRLLERALSRGITLIAISHRPDFAALLQELTGGEAKVEKLCLGDFSC